MSKQTHRRNIEGSGKAVQQRAGKEKVPATRSPVVELHVGTRMAELLTQSANTQRDAIKMLEGKNAETVEQAILELRQAQYTAQAAVMGIKYAKGMEPVDFMDKHKASDKYKEQRSLAANFSRTIRICKGIAQRLKKHLAVSDVFKCTNIAKMAAMFDRSGTPSDPEKLKSTPISAGRFKVLEATTDRLIAPDALNDPEKVALLEAHIRHVLEIAAKASLVLSEGLRRDLGLKAKAPARRLVA